MSCSTFKNGMPIIATMLDSVIYASRNRMLSLEVDEVTNQSGNNDKVLSLNVN